MCGILGMFDPNDNIVYKLRLALFAINGRGQEACGISVQNGTGIKIYKNEGLVFDVLTDDVVNSINGHAGIGQVRYSTTGDSNFDNAQPMYCKTDYGDIHVVHNGNIVNAAPVRNHLESIGIEFGTANSDTDVLIKFVKAYYDGDMKSLIKKIQSTFIGSYSLIFLLKDRIVGYRDKWANRPLLLGRLNGSFLLSSEVYSFKILEGELIRDIAPGEMITINEDGISSAYLGSTGTSTCAFEYIYLQDSTGIVDEIYVSSARYKMGVALASKIGDYDIDIVTGVPETGVIAAQGLADASCIDFRTILIKNRYSIRTFIEPDQEVRKHKIAIKFKVIPEYVTGYSILLVDDSIVLGNTMKGLVKMLRSYNPKAIHVAVASPMIVQGCRLGVDMKATDTFIAKDKTPEQIADELGLDSVTYLSREELAYSIGRPKNSLCMSCFGGQAPKCLEELEARPSVLDIEI